MQFHNKMQTKMMTIVLASHEDYELRKNRVGLRYFEAIPVTKKKISQYSCKKYVGVHKHSGKIDLCLVGGSK